MLDPQATQFDPSCVVLQYMQHLVIEEISYVLKMILIRTSILRKLILAFSTSKMFTESLGLMMI